ncbi:MAG: hypothetical protein KKG59_05995 [Nanoarchaeota archaeon]|nr:hypothetical protein [Nanoarchaeota archaeon]
MIKSTFIFLFAFLLGSLATLLYAESATGSLAMPTGMGVIEEIPSPQDHIPEEDIWIYKNKVIINVDNPEWASFSDTNSMDPVLDIGHNAIEIVPKSLDEIEVGDIVSYKSSMVDGTIIHRVIYKGVDEKGEYLIMKGDNNPNPDPERVRFDQVRRMVIGILY